MKHWDENDETPETEPEPQETTHSDDWGDTENEDDSTLEDDCS